LQVHWGYFIHKSQSVNRLCTVSPLSHAQQIANHESPKTTKLYDRTSDQITLDEVDKIII